MGRPKIVINHLNGQLGRVTPTKDAVAGLILSGVAVTSLALSTPKHIFALREATDLGFTAVNNPLAYGEIEAFYNKAGDGSELWIMLISDTTLLADVCNKNNPIARKLLDAANGTIRILGINRKLPSGYTMVNTECVDADVLQAKINLQALLEEYQSAHKPFRAILPHLGFSKTLTGALHNFRQDTHNGIGMISWSAAVTGQPAIGHTLGKLAAIAVQRNLGRVRDGDEGLLAAYYPDGTPVTELEAGWDSLHDKGLIFLIKHYGRSGYYFVGDNTCAAITDDYSQLSSGRTIDKAHTIIYDVLLDELLDDIDTDDNGFVSEAFVLSIQSSLENAIINQMNQNISGTPIISVPAGQNFLGTEKINMRIKIRPKGHIKDIEADLSFDNPLNS